MPEKKSETSAPEETALAPTEAAGAVATQPETALKLYNVTLPAMLSASIDPDMAEDMEGLRLGFDRVPWPGAGNLAIKVPNFADPTAKPRTIEDLDVVILHNHAARAFYSVPFDQRGPEDSKAPDCYSVDGENGLGAPGGSCASCEKAKFIPKVGTPCPLKRRLYCLIVGEKAIDGELPFVLDVPVTSTSVFTKYLEWLVKSGKPAMNKLVTRISFEEKVSKGGVTYTHGQFSLIGTLPVDTFESMSQVKRRIKEWAVSSDAMQAAAQAAPATATAADDTPF